MHVRETVELAGWIATHRHAIPRTPVTLSPQGLEEYWAASRCRLNHWSRALKRQSARLKICPSADLPKLWRLTLPVLEEILTGEILCRVWAAVCCLTECESGQSEATPIARNVLAGHLEARRRAMQMIAGGQGLPVKEAVLLNRLRRRNERWTDMLLSACGQGAGVEQFAFSRSRLRDFAPSARLGAASALMMPSLRSAYRDGLSTIAANADLNGRIVASILLCIPPHEFDSTGLLRSAWMQRLTRTASDTEGMIAQLLQLDDPADPHQHPSRFGTEED